MSDRPDDAEAEEETHTDDESEIEGTAADESEWRFGLDEVGPDAAEPEQRSIEPEGIDLENAAFVALGVLVAIGTILATLL